MATEQDPPGGVPEWVVTYGDMMSLLLTFFIMLVSLGELKGEQKFKTMMQSIMQRLGYISGPASPSGEAFPMNSLVEGLNRLGSKAEKQPDPGRGGVNRGGPTGEDLRVYRNRDGVCVSMGGPLVFAPGSAELSPAAQRALLAIAVRLAGKPNKIEIRGHTSSQPPPAGSPFADNTILSYERARAVYRILSESEPMIPTERMRVAASGETEPPSETAEKLSLASDRVEVYALDAYTRDLVD
jgi:chemotaxis protein MotB